MPDDQAVVLLLLLPLVGFLTTAVSARRRSSRACAIALPGAGDRLRLLQTGRVRNHVPGSAIGVVGMAGGYPVVVGR